jgi:hypothetical protein
VRETAKVAEVSKIAARADELSKIVNEAAETTKASVGATIATRLEKLDQILPEVRAVTETQKRIEAGIDRRSRFEERVVLDRYNAAATVVGQIQRVATDVNRCLHHQTVEGLFNGNELVPLTTVYETLAAQRYLLGEGLYEILQSQAAEILRIAKAQTSQEQTDATNRYLELQKQFNHEMNRIFRIDRMEW